jgi:hypothetical protein
MRSKFDVERFWSRVAVTESNRCWPWTGGKNNHGYGTFRMGGKNIAASRAAFFMRYDKWPENEACHTCDNRMCCNPDHIYDGTHAENMRDMKDRKRQNPCAGSAHPLSKLTESKVAKIRSEYKEGNISIYALAKKNGVSFSTIQRVVAGKTWNHK